MTSIRDKILMIGYKVVTKNLILSFRRRNYDNYFS
jgi:hypothetical protein